MNPPTAIRVALLGNPNTGKTTLFNALAGLNHRTGNYPGVTVEVKKGKGIHGVTPIEWIDLPGTYSLAARSPDEMLAVDLILGRIAGEPKPDVLLCLADATNLERNLYLISQARELGLPIVVALTMNDLAESQAITVDLARLELGLGLPVVAILAARNKGISQLKDRLLEAAKGPTPAFDPPLPAEVINSAKNIAQDLDSELPPALALRALLDEGGSAEVELVQQYGAKAAEMLASNRASLTQAGHAVAVLEPRHRYKDLRKRLAGVVTRPKERQNTFSDRLDRWLVHPIWGVAFFLFVMLLLFQSIFFFASPAMDVIDGGMESLQDLARNNLQPGPFTSLLVDGVLAGVGGVVIFLPQIIILFGFLGILEDCGYMARAAFLMDRIMSRCGLSGKSFIPLLSSLACAVPGILSTRVIENRRDRLATILVAPLMSCSARLPVYTLFSAAFFPDPWWLAGTVMFGLYATGFVVAPLVALILRGSLLKGDVPLFVLEMPTYRRPAILPTLKRMWDAGTSFLYRAGTLILATMVLVWALLYFPSADSNGLDFPTRIANANPEDQQGLVLEWKEQSWLGRTGKALEPVFIPLGWDWRIGMSVLASFPAREVVVAALGVSFGEGEVAANDEEGRNKLTQRLKAATWPDGRPLFTTASALSLLVFFALCCQCASTLAVIARETRSIGWAIFTFSYMTTLAYAAAFAIYQTGRLFG